MLDLFDKPAPGAKPNELVGKVLQIGFLPSLNAAQTGHFIVRLEGRERPLRFLASIPRDMAEELTMGQRGDVLTLRFAGGLVQDFVEPTFVTVRPPEPFVPARWDGGGATGVQLCADTAQA